MNRVFRLALCQMSVADDKEKNVATALKQLEIASEGKADAAVLPEMFNCPYDKNKFPQYAESAGNSPTLKALSEKAGQLGIYVFGGSIPEEDGGHIYNSCFVFGRDGKLLGRHRKVHLFDIDVAGKIRFKESETLTPGDGITVVDTEFCKVGVGICYDIRFPELARTMVLKGAEALIFPAAFNMVTGPAHWELLMRSRALDNQAFVAAVSPARDTGAAYIAYGNSLAADPWGSIMVRAGDGEEMVFADLDPVQFERVRGELPVLKQRKPEIYRL